MIWSGTLEVQGVARVKVDEEQGHLAIRLDVACARMQMRTVSGAG